VQRDVLSCGKKALVMASAFSGIHEGDLVFGDVFVKKEGKRGGLTLRFRCRGEESHVADEKLKGQS